MERDFLGLSSRESLTKVKEEACSAGFHELGMQWPFLNKVAAVQHLMSLNVAQAANAQKLGNFTPISIPGQKCPKSDEIQVLNQPIPVPVGDPIFKNQFASNLVSNPIKAQCLGRFPGATPESCKSVKASGSSTQLTIFYAGAVCVYDDISPEKVQAIISLAGNGASVATSTARPKLLIQTPSSKPVPNDVFPPNQPASTPPSSGRSSPLSASSHTGVQSQSGSTTTDEGTVAKTTGTLTPISKVEPPKMVHVIGSVAPTSMIPSVPQARKASLARFLEKRKERVMNATPYNLSKKSPERSTSESTGMNFVDSSAAIMIRQ